MSKYKIMNDSISISSPDGFSFSGSRIKNPDNKNWYSGETHFTDGSVFHGVTTETGEPLNGRMTYPNRNIYQGTFCNGQKESGRMVYVSPRDVLWRNNSIWQSTYLGDWKNDKWHGKGKLFTCSSTGRYEGNWENGEPSGEFEITITEDTDMYAKQFMDLGERRCNPGVRYTISGTIVNGRFRGDATIVTKSSNDEWKQIWETSKCENVWFD